MIKQVSKNKTKKKYVEYLNEIGESLPRDSFILAGKLRHGLYGKLLRFHDPIAFEVGYREWNP